MKPALIICMLLLLFPCRIPAQYGLTSKSKRATGMYREAHYAYGIHEYEKARESLIRAIETDPRFIEAYLLLAEVYTDLDQPGKSVEAYEKAIGLDPAFFPNAFILMARNEMRLEKYSSAMEHLQEYLSMGTAVSPEKKEEVNRLIRSCRFAEQAIRNPVPFDPENLGDDVNSEHDDYWPSLSADEQTLFLTVLLPVHVNWQVALNRLQEDLYYCGKINGEWTPARFAGKILNTYDNEGAQTVSADGKYMVFTACNRPGGEGNCDLYFSENKNGKWTPPVNMGPPVNSAYSDKQPSLSSDGMTLYFSSNRKGTRGGLDIWKTRREPTGDWADPENLGDSINTRFDEGSPFIHPDRQTLYFASDGWPGMGGFDMFMSKKRAGGGWTLPRNLGYPINTSGNEEGLIVNALGNRAYFASDRLAGKGRDLYTFELYNGIRPAKVSYMKGRVYDAKTGKPLGAKFELISLSSQRPVIQSFSSPGTGEFLVCIPSTDDYGLNVSKTNYLFYSEHFSMQRIYERDDPFLMDIPLEPIEAGRLTILRNVFFEFDSSRLREESRAELDRVVTFLRQHPHVRIEISGHTDNTGTAEYNLALSRKRAQSVTDYLTGHGISPARLVSKGYGMHRPVATNETEEGRARNRRTEMKILENRKK